MTDNPFDVGYVEPEPAEVEVAPVQTASSAVYHDKIQQGSMEWYEARLGLMTASEMKLVLTPKLKLANNDKTKAHVYELLAQRISGYVEPIFESFDMLRGCEDEIEARMLYAQNYAPVDECGFITNDQWGFTIGYSPDGLVGDDGLVEIKSRKQKYQIQTIVECASAETAPEEYMLQIQTGLLVSGRKWLDFVSYSGGLPMTTTRIYPDAEYQKAIVMAARDFEERIAHAKAIYEAMMTSGARLVPTERSDRPTGDLK
jgi:hypothetical protein